VLLAGDFLYNWATISENLPGLLADTIAGIGMSAQLIAEGLDLLAACAGWHWQIPAFPTLAPFTLVAPEAIGCCALPWWYATKFVPARATWMVQEFLPYTMSVARWSGWAVTVRFRAMATVCQYAVGALFETYALGCSLYAANTARQREEWATVRAELAHACASISIIAGSLIALYCVYFLWTVPVLAAALVVIGVVGHLLAWYFGPESYAEGRLESDLRALGVLPPDIVELSPVNGWHLNDDTTDVVPGEPIARYYETQDIAGPPARVSLAVRSQVLFNGLQGLQPVTTGEEASRWHPRFLHDLWSEPGTLTDQVPNGTVVAAEQVVGTVRAADGGVISRLAAREAGTVIWLTEPLVLADAGVNRYGEISSAD
jgi:hypothetical protein